MGTFRAFISTFSAVTNYLKWFSVVCTLFENELERTSLKGNLIRRCRISNTNIKIHVRDLVTQITREIYVPLSKINHAEKYDRKLSIRIVTCKTFRHPRVHSPVSSSNYLMKYTACILMTIALIRFVSFFSQKRFHVFFFAWCADKGQYLALSSNVHEINSIICNMLIILG